ncbi:MAG: sorbosone dehydrogenase [Gammaproteobacteria bacterium]|nr:sorbosone dehydrogenase [Gammaproteobacteria bacterium]
MRLSLVLTLSILAAGCGGSGTPSGATNEQAGGTNPVPGDVPVEAIACDADNGGITLPPNFCAVVVASDLGAARHLVARENGDIYVALRGDDGGVAVLRDTDGDARADFIQQFGPAGGTGIDIHDGYLYFATNTDVYRWELGDGPLPPGDPELVIAGFAAQPSHASKSFAFMSDGDIVVNIGAPSNACQQTDRAFEDPGLDPCPMLETSGGIWRFAAGTGQTPADGSRYATGIRNGLALAMNPVNDRLYVVQHGRDQLSELWPAHYTDEQRAELPAEELFAVDPGDDFGWPYCYYDQQQQRKVLAPEYGGDGQAVDRCAAAENPVFAFPAHWAPNDLIFYNGDQFPQHYHNGAFVAFHGSWNRQPFVQQGYNVVFLPFNNGEVAGEFEVFADDFAGVDDLRAPGSARHRPTGLALAADGSLLVADSAAGRIWRIFYID